MLEAVNNILEAIFLVLEALGDPVMTTISGLDLSLDLLNAPLVTGIFGPVA